MTHILKTLLPLIDQKDGKWRHTVEKNVEAWWKLLDKRAHVEANPVNPQLVAWALSSRLPDNVILTSDSASCANWYARDIKIRTGMMASLSGGLASMGAAVPYAIAAKYAHPDRPVIGLVGDGAMQMNNMAELITVAKYWRDWADHRFIICVFNNEDLNQVTWEQGVMEGDPKLGASQSIPDVPYHRFAELIGLRGLFVDRPEALGPAWAEALASDRPVLLEVKTDPEVPPMPPHLTFEQVKKLTTTLVKGDSNEEGVVRGTVRQVLSSVLPGGTNNRSDAQCRKTPLVDEHVPLLFGTNSLAERRGERLQFDSFSIEGHGRVSCRNNALIVSRHERGRSRRAVHGTGSLTIDWMPGGKVLILDWAEQGVEVKPAPAGRGFGNVLLSAVVEKQIGGQITRDWKDYGLSLRIALPSLDRVGSGPQHKR